MKEIMFWSDDLNPNDYQNQKVDPEYRQEAIARLKLGRVANSYRGCANCRICGARLGSRDLTDGRFLWPEKAEHYLEEHNLWIDDLSRFVNA